MFVLEPVKNYKYTRLRVPITLNKCPSDIKNSEYYIDINIESFSQQDCYIGEDFVKQFVVERKNYKKENSSIKEACWNIELIIEETITEDQAVALVDELCELLTLHCAQYTKLQNSGIGAFDYNVFGDIINFN